MPDDTWTTIDGNFQYDGMASDFSGMPDGQLRIFFYSQAFAALNREVRSPRCGRGLILVSVIDEFTYMARVPWLATFAAEAAKTWRTFGAHLWTMDHAAHPYLRTEGGVVDEAMLSVFLNAPIKILFRQVSITGR